MKKAINFILILAVLFSSCIFTVDSNATFDALYEGKFLSNIIYMISLDNETVIFSKNADVQTHPASLTKIATAAVVLDNVEDLETMVTVKEELIRVLDGTGSSLGGLKPDEQISILNLLHLMLIHSANEAAMVLADYVGEGDIDSFVAMMNRLAADLGCTNTNFVNPHGLDDDNQYTTAKDIAKITRYAMENDTFAEIVKKQTYTLPESNMNKERTIKTTNYMLNKSYKEYYQRYVVGVKTGSTSTAGKCVVTVATNDGYSYLAVAMKAPYEDIDKDGYLENGSFIDCKSMYDWAFANLKLTCISDSGKIIAEVPVRRARSTDHVSLSPKEDSYDLVPVGIETDSLQIVPDEETMPKYVNAPVKKGETICTAKVMYAGEPIAEIELVATSTIHLSLIGIFSGIFGTILGPWYMKLAIVAAIVIAILIYRKKRNEKRAKYDRNNVVTLGQNTFRGLRK